MTSKEKPADVNVLEIGETEAKLPSPIDLNIKIVKEVELPSLKWYNSDETPRLMKISNSGHSIIVTAKWFGPRRPYITGSHLPGMYIFSQAHFHWGKNEREGSEHTIEGSKLPLELHVMYFKTDYGTHEKAMKEVDGIVVMAYLYNIRKQPNVRLMPITESMIKVIEPYTSAPIELMSISQLVPVFTDDYYLYWGSVFAQTDYRILWLIHREAQTISAQQLATFRMVMGANNEPLLSNFRGTKSVNGRTILFVNPKKPCSSTLIEAPPDPEENETGSQPEANNTGTGKKSKAAAPKLKPAKRKSSVRRKSRKESEKGHQSAFDDGWGEDHTSHDRVLMTAVSVTVGDESSPANSSSESFTSCSSTSLESRFYDGDLDQHNAFLKQETEVKDNATMDIPSLVNEGNINAKCEQLLSLLHSTIMTKRDTCLPMLDELEKYIMASRESINDCEAGYAKKIDPMRTDYISNESNILSQFLSDTREVEELNKNNTNLSTLKDPRVVNESSNGRENFQVSQSSSSQNSSTPNDIQCHPIQWSKYPEKQYTEMFMVPQHDQRTICYTDCRILDQIGSERTQEQGPRSEIPVSLIGKMRNQKRTENKLRANDESPVVKNGNAEVWNLPEMLRNNALFKGILQQVAGSSGLKFVSNETMTVLTAQSSSDDSDTILEPSITAQNVSFVSQQNTIMEIDSSSLKSSIPERYIGQKLETLKRRKSIKLFNTLGGNAVDRGMKRQSIITEIFQKNITTPRSIARTAKGSIPLKTCRKAPMPSTRIKKPEKGTPPAWKY